MPIIPQTYACDHCGTVSKPEPDHWYIIRGRPIDPANEFNRRAPSLDIQVFYPGWTYWPSAPALPPYFACGENCLAAIVSRLLPGLIVDPTQTPTATKEKTPLESLMDTINSIPKPSSNFPNATPVQPQYIQPRPIFLEKET